MSLTVLLLEGADAKASRTAPRLLTICYRARVYLSGVSRESGIVLGVRHRGWRAAPGESTLAQPAMALGRASPSRLERASARSPAGFSTPVFTPRVSTRGARTGFEERPVALPCLRPRPRQGHARSGLPSLSKERSLALRDAHNGFTCQGISPGSRQVTFSNAGPDEACSDWPSAALRPRARAHSQAGAAQAYTPAR